MKYYEKLKQLVETELDEYSHTSFEIFCEQDEPLEEIFIVKIERLLDETKELRFRCTEEKIEVDLNENWTEVNEFSYLKYFWIALLT